jgi:hypothetical protein
VGEFDLAAGMTTKLGHRTRFCGDLEINKQSQLTYSMLRPRCGHE